jgi:hypothetical protein
MAMPFKRPALVLLLGTALLAWGITSKASALPQRGEVWKLRLRVRAGSFFTLQADLAKMFQNMGQVVSVTVQNAMLPSTEGPTTEVNAFLRYDVDATEAPRPGMLAEGAGFSVELVSASRWTGPVPS